MLFLIFIIVIYIELNDYDCYYLYNIDDCRDLII